MACFFGLGSDVKISPPKAQQSISGILSTRREASYCTGCAKRSLCFCRAVAISLLSACCKLTRNNHQKCLNQDTNEDNDTSSFPSEAIGTYLFHCCALLFLDWVWLHLQEVFFGSTHISQNCKRGRSEDAYG